MNIYLKTLSNIEYELNIINISPTIFELINCDIYNYDDYEEYKDTIKIIFQEIEQWEYSYELEKLLYFKGYCEFPI